MIEISTYRQVYKVPSVLDFRLKLGSRLYKSDDVVNGCVGWGSGTGPVSTTGEYKSILCWEIGSDSGYSDFDFGDEKTKRVYIGVDGSCSLFLEGDLGVEIMELSRIVYNKLESLTSDILDYNLNDAIHFVFSDLTWIRDRKLGLLL
jgi:hypothetical protein